MNELQNSFMHAKVLVQKETTVAYHVVDNNKFNSFSTSSSDHFLPLGVVAAAILKVLNYTHVP